MLKCKKNIPFIIAGIIICLIIAMYLVAMFDSGLRNSYLKSFNLFYIIKLVFGRSITRRLYGYCTLGIALVVTVLLLNDTKGYQSKQMQITDTISVPVPAGQGQCGTAKWLPKDQYSKAFAHYTLDETEFDKWTEVNLKDIEEELARIEKEGL